MLITRRWLERFIDLRTYSDQVIADQLSRLGFETNVQRKVNNQGIKLAQIKQITKLPNTNRLFHCLISVVNGDQTVRVVCSDDTLRVRQWVIYAPPKAVLASGMKMTDRLIRGHRSSGMLCSLAELGIGSGQERKVWTLSHRPHRPKTGQDLVFAEWSGINDTIFEVELTVNRGDCLGILFLARELAAGFGLRWKTPHYDPFQSPVGELKIQKLTDEHGFDRTRNDHWPSAVNHLQLDLKVTNRDAVWLWQVLLLSWSDQQRLPIADLMMLYHVGAPVHQHVLSIAQWRLVFETGYPVMGVDPATISHQLVLSDQIVLGPDSAQTGWGLLDGSRMIQLIGPTPTNFAVPLTNRWLLVMVLIDPQIMRHQQKITGQQGPFYDRLIRRRSLVTANLLVYYVRKVSRLLTVNWQAWTILRQQSPLTLVLNAHWLADFLSLSMTTKALRQLLRPLGYRVLIVSGRGWRVMVPPVRIDVINQHAIAGELLRLIGYHRLKPQRCYFAPAAATQLLAAPQQNLIHHHQRLLKLLVAHRFVPIYGRCLVSRQLANRFNWAGHHLLATDNPLAETHAVWQTSLLPQLLSALQYNQDRGVEQVQLFATGHVIDSRRRERPLRYVTLLLSGPRRSLDVELQCPSEPSFQCLKQWWNRIGTCLKLDLTQCEWKVDSVRAAANSNQGNRAPNFQPSIVNRAWQKHTFFHPRQLFVIYYRQAPIAWLGCLTNLTPQKCSITLNNLYFLELNLSCMLRDLPPIVRQIKPPSSFKAVVRDLTYQYDGTVQTEFQRIAQLITNHLGTLLEQIQLIDVYRLPWDGTPLWNMTVRISFAHPTDVPLDNVTTDQVMQKLKRHLATHAVTLPA